MSLPRCLRPLALAFGIGLAVAVAGAPADAVEAPPGSKNFTPPADVPNYFSNESGPFHSSPTASGARPGVVPMVAAPARRDRHTGATLRTSHHHHPAHVAKARGRTRVAHGKAAAHGAVAHASAHRQVAHTGAARRGHASGSNVAHARVRHLAGKTVAAKSRAASSKSKHLTRAHG